MLRGVGGGRSHCSHMPRPRRPPHCEWSRTGALWSDQTCPIYLSNGSKLLINVNLTILQGPQYITITVAILWGQPAITSCSRTRHHGQAPAPRTLLPPGRSSRRGPGAGAPPRPHSSRGGARGRRAAQRDGAGGLFSSAASCIAEGWSEWTSSVICPFLSRAIAILIETFFVLSKVSSSVLHETT